MRKKKEQKNDNKDSVCTSEYQLDQLGQFAWWKHFPSLSKKSLLVRIIKFFGDNRHSVRLW